MSLGCRVAEGADKLDAITSAAKAFTELKAFTAALEVCAWRTGLSLACALFRFSISPVSPVRRLYSARLRTNSRVGL
jgi:hypothetical protein